MNPIISVIIPNYNHAAFLKQRIDSVLNQTWQNFEVIILDDCSTDNSREIIELYREHQKVSTVIYNDINSGSAFKQWQKGLELSTGNYIWIAESDDFSDKTLLQTLIQPFLNLPDLILSYCQSILVDENSRHLGVANWGDELDAFKWKEDYIEESFVELQNYLNFRNTIINASAVLFRKPLSNTILQESCDMKMLGDWLFWKKLLSSPGKIAFNSSPLNFFRLHDQTTRSATTKQKELIRMKEYRQLIVPEFLSIVNNRYDWMIREWASNRQVLKKTRYYYFPDLPIALIVRFILIYTLKIPGKSIIFIRHNVYKLRRFFFKNEEEKFKVLNK